MLLAVLLLTPCPPLAVADVGVVHRDAVDPQQMRREGVMKVHRPIRPHLKIALHLEGTGITTIETEVVVVVDRMRAVVARRMIEGKIPGS